MLSIAKILIVSGIVLFLIGLGIFLTVRLGIPLGKLPGDIVFRRGGVTIVIPIVTSILISLVVTVVINVILQFLKK